MVFGNIKNSLYPTFLSGYRGSLFRIRQLSGPEEFFVLIAYLAALSKSDLLSVIQPEHLIAKSAYLINGM